MAIAQLRPKRNGKGRMQGMEARTDRPQNVAQFRPLASRAMQASRTTAKLSGKDTKGDEKGGYNHYILTAIPIDK